MDQIYQTPNSILETQTYDTSSTLNPWLSIWTKPRATIQQIIDTNPKRFVLLISAIAGISNTLDRASMKSIGDSVELPFNRSSGDHSWAR